MSQSAVSTRNSSVDPHAMTPLVSAGYVVLALATIGIVLGIIYIATATSTGQLDVPVVAVYVVCCVLLYLGGLLLYVLAKGHDAA